MGGFAPVAGVAQSGSSLLFDGVDDYVEVGNPAALQITGPITLECWFKTSDPTIGDFQTLMGKWWSGGSVRGAAYGLFWSDSGLQFSIANDNGINFSVNSGQHWNDGEWHHVAGTWDGSEVRIFVDGILMGTTVTPGFTRISNVTHKVRIGTDDRFNPGEGNRFFNGSIDEARIWNVSRNVTDIRQNAHRRLAGTERGLAGYWHLDEGRGDTTYDRTISISDGRLGNATADHMPGWDPDAITSYLPPVFGTTEGSDLGLTLPGTDPDGTAVTPFVTALPENGRLFQTPDGTTKGLELSSPFGSAMRFDGKDDYLQVGPVPELEFTDNFTIEAWIRPDGRQGGIIVNREGEYEIAVFPDGTIQWAIANTNPGWGWHSTGFVVPEGKWTHVSLSYAGGEVRTYANGVLVETFNGSGMVSDLSSHSDQDDFRIGGRQGASQFFAGAIDEVRVWNRVLSDAEIAAQYDQMLVGNEAGLVALFHFDEGTGTVAADSSPNGLDGIAGGGAPAANPAWISSGFLDSGGIAVTNALGRVLYEPAPGFVGPDSFRYFVRDSDEDSAESIATVNVKPLNQLPMAASDMPDAFQDFTTVLDVLSNDTDGDGDPLDIITFSQPANGTVTLNPDGTFTYEPDPGFTGADPFTYRIADREVWNRAADRDPGTVNSSFVGNPDTGAFGLPVWQMEYVRGDVTAGPAPWYANRGAKLVWDPDWFGTGGLWAKGDDISPPIYGNAAHDSTEEDPVVRWISPFDNFEADTFGQLTTHWGVGSGPVDVEIVIAHHDVSSGVVTELFMTSVSKPTADTSVEEVTTAVDLSAIALDRGDSIVITQRPVSKPAGARFLIDDELFILPASATNAATVTVNVRGNERPQVVGSASLPNPELYLTFDGHALDSSGHERDGTLFGDAGFSTTIPAAIGTGQSLALDGTGDHALVAGDPALEGSPFTLSYWVNQDGNTQNGGFERITARSGFTFETAVGGSGNISFFPNWTGTGVSLPPDGWRHLTWVSQGGTLRLFVDGVQQFSHATTPNPTGDLGIGANPGGSEGFAGLIDEVVLWSSALSDEDITLLAAAGLGDLISSSVEETPEDTDLTIELAGTDADNDQLTAILTVLPDRGTLYQTPDGTTRGAMIDTVPATVTDSMNRVIYVPLLNFSGADLLAYHVNDGKVDSEEGTISITVTSVNDAPIAVDDIGGSTVIDLPIVTKNVFTNDFDPEGDAFELASFDTMSSAGGTVTSNDDGTFSYTPFPGFTGDDSFSYSLTDGVTAGTPGIVTITVATLNTYTWNNPGGGNWGDSGSWTPNGIPGEGDLALIDLAGDYTVTVDVDVSVAVIEMSATGGTQTLLLNGSILSVQNQALFGPTTRYRQSGGVLEGPGNVFFDGTVDWAGGYMRDAGRKVNRGTFTASASAGNVHLDRGCVFENEGSLLFNSVNRDFYAFGGATILNKPGALWDVQSERDMPEAAGTHATFINQGEFRKSVVGGTTHTTWTFLNEGGTVNLQNGVMEFDQGGSSIGGNFLLEAGAGLYLDGGTFSFDADTTLSGAGQFRIRGATVPFNGNFGITGNVAMSSGRWIANSDILLPAIYSQSGGNLEGPGNVFFDGSVDWTGGYMRDAGRKVNRGSFTASASAGNVHLDRGCVFENEGSLLFNSPNHDFYAFGGATILNKSGALWDVQTARDMPEAAGTHATFINQGEFRRSGVGGTAYTTWTFLNEGGTVNLQNGVMEFDQGGSSTGGDLLLEAGAGLYLDGGTFSFDADTTLSGAGQFRIRGATVPFNGNFGITGNVAMSSGRWIANSDILLPAIYSQSGGNLEGPGNVFFDGSVDWTGGYMRDAGRKVNRGTFTASASAGNVHLDRGCVFENEGSLLFNSPNRDFYAYGGATILNKPGALWDVQTERDMPEAAGTHATFINQGEFRRSGADGTAYTTWTFLNEGGTVNLQNGVMEFDQGGSSTGGSFLLEAGGALYLDGGTFSFDADTTLSGAGQFRIRGATVPFNGGFDVTGNVAMSSGRWITNSDILLPAIYSQSGGNLEGPGNVFFDGTVDWAGGYMRDAGRKVNRGTFTASASSSHVHFDRGCVFENEGSLLFNSPNRDFYAFGGATILNKPGALWDVQTDRDMPESAGTHATFTNQGEFRRSGAGGTAYTTWTFLNEGVINIQSGELDFRQELTQPSASAAIFLAGGNLRKTGTFTLDDGLINGSGTIAGNVANNGATIRPGSPLGNISITGNFAQGPGGTLEMNISGDAASGNFDTLSIGGTATLAGTFRLVTGAFAATPGETYELITYPSRPGSTTFDNVTGVSSQNGIDYLAMYLTDRFNLTTQPAGPSDPEAPMPDPILKDPGSGFDQWLREAFGPTHDADNDFVCGDLADPDHDGLCNLLEYAFGGDPLKLTPRSVHPDGHVDLIGTESYLCLSYYRRKTTDLNYIVEGSLNLLDWESNADQVAEMFVEELTPPSPFFEKVTVRSASPINPDTPGFLRIRVERIIP